VLSRVVARTFTLGEAAELVGGSYRQAQRLVARHRQDDTSRWSIGR
jgi:hypothetical protein